MAVYYLTDEMVSRNAPAHASYHTPAILLIDDHDDRLCFECDPLFGGERKHDMVGGTRQAIMTHEVNEELFNNWNRLMRE